MKKILYIISLLVVMPLTSIAEDEYYDNDAAYVPYVAPANAQGQQQYQYYQYNTDGSYAQQPAQQYQQPQQQYYDNDAAYVPYVQPQQGGGGGNWATSDPYAPQAVDESQFDIYSDGY